MNDSLRTLAMEREKRKTAASTCGAMDSMYKTMSASFSRGDAVAMQFILFGLSLLHILSTLNTTTVVWSVASYALIALSLILAAKALQKRWRAHVQPKLHATKDAAFIASFVCAFVTLLKILYEVVSAWRSVIVVSITFTALSLTTSFKAGEVELGLKEEVTSLKKKLEALSPPPSSSDIPPEWNSSPIKHVLDEPRRNNEVSLDESTLLSNESVDVQEDNSVQKGAFNVVSPLKNSSAGCH